MFFVTWLLTDPAWLILPEVFLPAWPSSVQDSEKQCCHDFVVFKNAGNPKSSRYWQKQVHSVAVLVSWLVVLGPAELLHEPPQSLEGATCVTALLSRNKRFFFAYLHTFPSKLSEKREVLYADNLWRKQGAVVCDSTLSHWMYSEQQWKRLEQPRPWMSAFHWVVFVHNVYVYCILFL